MNLATNVKPISYLKSNAANLIKEITESREPMLITQNGESKIVLVDVETYQQQQQTMALLKILALGKKQIQENKVVPAEDVANKIKNVLAQAKAK